MSDPVELIFLNPLPFDGRFWAPVQANFGDVRSHRPTISSLGSSLVDAAHAVLELATGDRLVVVGNSVGGSCALEVAAAAPDRVEHVVLIGAKAGHRPEPDYCRWALELLESEGPAEAWDRIWRPLFSPRTPDRIIATARSAALAVPENDLAHGIRQFHGRRDLSRFAAAWPKPITAVSGERPWARPGGRTHDVLRLPTRDQLPRRQSLVVVTTCRARRRRGPRSRNPEGYRLG